MDESGLLPITDLHGVLQQAGFVSDDCAINDFKALLDKVGESSNNSDVWSRMKGYVDAKTMHDGRLQRRTPRDTKDRTDILAERAATQQKDVAGTLDIKKQQVDVQ